MKKDDIVFMLPIGEERRRIKDPVKATVVSVGPKYITVKYGFSGNRTMRFYNDVSRLEFSNYSPCYRLFDTEEEAREYQAMEDEIAFIRANVLRSVLHLNAEERHKMVEIINVALIRAKLPITTNK